MAKERVRDVMTVSTTRLPADQTVTAAARLMEAENVGDVIVTGVSDDIRGVVTDRDIAVRAVARGLDPKTTSLGDICSTDLVTVGSDTKLEEAARVMAERAVRRLPVVDDGKLVGVVSLGDLAERRDPESVLGGISSAPPNR
jgi:CBS domain-containing protein